MNETGSAAADRYLVRIGHGGGGVRADRDCLDDLLRRHVASIPFENVDSFAPVDARRGVPLDPDSLADKLLGAADGGPSRGGYCFEHAGLLQWVLPSYGFEVRAASGRVYVDPDHAPGTKTHHVTIVRLGGRDVLADPGFGGMTPTASLDLESTGRTQPTPHGNYRVLPIGEAGVDVAAAPDLDVMVQAEVSGDDGPKWINLYGLDLGPVVAPDVRALNWYIATSPASPFVRRFSVALAPEGARVTVAGMVTRTRAGGVVTERQLATPADFDSALRTAGVEVDGATIGRVMERLASV